MIELTLNPSDDITAILNAYSLDQHITIHLNPGYYHQKLELNHHHLTLIGRSPKDTVITYNDYSYKLHEDGLLYNTFRTSTVAVLGEHITFKNLTIKNTAGRGFTIGQAVALSVYGTGFKAINCHFIGHQDTLFIGPLPVDLTARYDHFLPLSYRHIDAVLALFDDCTIEGDVDFIFGSGTSLFTCCRIVVVNEGYIFAPSTYQSFPYGMIVVNSIIEARVSSYIARPWREYAKLHLINCIIKGDIKDERYHAWDKVYFTFKEYPYHMSALSSSCDENELVKLMNFINQTFKVIV